MIGALRQKSATCASSASVYGKSFFKLKPAGSVVSSSLPEEICSCSARRFGSVRTFCGLPLAGRTTSLMQKRKVLENFQIVTSQNWRRSFSSDSEPSDIPQIETAKVVAPSDEIKEKPKGPPPKASATEPQLPPTERDRRISINKAVKEWELESRLETRDINPPLGVKAAMEMQVKAESKRRGQVLESEGTRQANINIPEEII